jgi:hypothetical protein
MEPAKLAELDSAYFDAVIQSQLAIAYGNGDPTACALMLAAGVLSPRGLTIDEDSDF